MRNARHQLILLGLVCQGFAWDGYGLALLNALLWVLALTLPRKPIHVPPALECLGIVAGGLGGYAASKAFGQSVHFSFGHAITALQLLRLLRPLDRREQVFTLIAACMQIGVACTIVFDYRFLLIFLGIATLLPRAFMELERAGFEPAAAGRLRPLRLGWVSAGVILLVALVFFLGFPRGFFGTPLPFRRGAPSQPTLADSVLDPANSGQAQSRQVLLQINGANLGYLRCFALSRIEGGRWAPEERRPRKYLNFVGPDQLPDYLPRQVRVKQSPVLGRILPTDGRAVFLRGNFFQLPYLNTQDAIESDSMWNRPKNAYEYWTDPNPAAVNLSARERERFLQHPEVSPRLQTWLAERVAGTVDPLAQARRLEAHLRDTFTYELGGPELNRLNPTDDFLFRERRGHCERFAATLGLLLRLQGIPSRVVVGYVPNSRDWFSGWWNVRFADAHAWTEGWFPDRGWVQFDSTPRATLPLEGFNARQLLEDLDFAWYAHVVNFDAPMQSELFASVGRTEASRWLRAHPLALILPVAGFAGVLAWRKRLWERLRFPGRTRASPLQFARHHYGEMLRLLHRQGLDKPPEQTPVEFLGALAGRSPAVYPEVELITRVFCEARYGMRRLSAEQELGVASALERIRRRQPSR
jgi:transglutaminase-like putative cysteine protease